MQLNISTKLTKYTNSGLLENMIDCSILRLDLIHPFISGNKWFKLKYNLEAFKNSGAKQIITIGGAYSNHLVATASACNKLNIKCIGIVRGEEPLNKNERLLFLAQNKMQLVYVNRELYRDKNKLGNWISKNFESYYFIPEGGSNKYAVKGCSEILNEIEDTFDYVVCPCGTGATLAGLIAGKKIAENIIGIPVLKNGEFLYEEINSLLNNYELENSITIKKEYRLYTDYHFGGYAKTNEELNNFILENNELSLEFVYSAKAFYALNDLVKKGDIKKRSKVLFIHTGGIFVDK